MSIFAVGDPCMRCNALPCRCPAWQYTPQPHRCPVCEGRGHLPTGFYTSTNPDGSSSSGGTAPEMCQTCSGQGIIWR
ncbi:hypothetical protein LCGC14_1121080 [marine sediment metagenome]|uniref:Uncharacterized protein n=1 Tax=marine sediment metagenome TaxID=412755 RepID=A0A0F9M3Z1_9ZZZZ